jgi:hypothetical protein
LRAPSCSHRDHQPRKPCCCCYPSSLHRKRRMNERAAYQLPDSMSVWRSWRCKCNGELPM